MIERSYNGWPASPSINGLNATSFEVPTVPGRRFTTVTVAAPLFKYLIRRFNSDVDAVPGGVLDDWSYCYRKARAANALSCHASATAVDLNATEYPMGRTNMTSAQVAAVNRILAECKGQFRWGGTFAKGYEDQMHFELVKGTSPASVTKTVHAMGLYPDGRQIHPDDLDARTDPQKIVLLKKALARVNYYPKRPVYNGRWNQKLAEAWRSWRINKPRQTVQERIDALGAKTNVF